jgi:hypothetical protein
MLNIYNIYNNINNSSYLIITILFLYSNNYIFNKNQFYKYKYNY